MRTISSTVLLIAIAGVAACAGGDDNTRTVSAEAEESEGDEMKLDGRLQAGAECLQLRTPDGVVYSLTGAPNAKAGDYVRITGTKADMSYCMAGEATIDVASVEAITPPQNELPQGYNTVSADYALGAWTAKGGDCRRPDFDVTRIPGGGLSVETRLDGAPRTGDVRTGNAPALVFDQPRRIFPLERRSPDGLAVLTPETGPVTLAGNRIEGDGVVFIRCSR